MSKTGEAPAVELTALWGRHSCVQVDRTIPEGAEPVGSLPRGHVASGPRPISGQGPYLCRHLEDGYLRGMAEAWIKR